MDVGWLWCRMWEIRQVFDIVAHGAYLDAVPPGRCGWAISHPFPDAFTQGWVLHTDLTPTGTATDDGIT